MQRTAQQIFREFDGCETSMSDKQMDFPAMSVPGLRTQVRWRMYGACQSHVARIQPQSRGHSVWVRAGSFTDRCRV